MSRILSLNLCAVVVMLSASVAVAGDFDFDRAIGHARNNDVESWVEGRESGLPNQRDSQFDDATPLASSMGNVISIQTQPGSHVVLNASQINKGNQTSEVRLRGMNFKRYRNVEIPKYDTDAYLYHSQ